MLATWAVCVCVGRVVCNGESIMYAEVQNPATLLPSFHGILWAFCNYWSRKPVEVIQVRWTPACCLDRNVTHTSNLTTLLPGHVMQAWSHQMFVATGMLACFRSSSCIMSVDVALFDGWMSPKTCVCVCVCVCVCASAIDSASNFAGYNGTCYRLWCVLIISGLCEQ